MPFALLVAALAVGAAAAGFILSRSADDGSSSVALDKHASAAGVQVSFPSTWRRARAPSDLDLLSDELALSPSGSPGRILVIGRGDRSDPSLLPPPLRSVLGAAPAAEIVSLGSLPFYRYRNRRPTGAAGRDSVYVLPTTSGPVVAACRTDAPNTGFTGNCERVLATIKLDSGTVLPRPSPTYAKRLNAILGPLSAASARAAARLRRATGPEAQIRQANRLAVRYGRAAAAIAKLNAGSASAANRTLAAALSSVGRAYSALALAVERHDASGDRAARASLERARRAMAGAFTELSDLGYRGG